MVYNINDKMPSQKKQVLLKILEALTQYWDLAEWFLLLLSQEENPVLEENLYKVILKEIKNINSEIQKEKIKNALQKLKETADKTVEIEKEEAETMLDEFINNI